MAKESGLGWTTASVDDSSGTLRAIINDVTNLEVATPRGVQETTGIDKSAIERLLLLGDCSQTWNGVFNDAASTGAHTVLKTAGSFTGNRTVTLAVSGQTLTNEMIQTDFAMTRGAGGELTWSAPFVLSDGTVPTWS